MKTNVKNYEIMKKYESMLIKFYQPFNQGLFYF